MASLTTIRLLAEKETVHPDYALRYFRLVQEMRSKYPHGKDFCIPGDALPEVERLCDAAQIPFYFVGYIDTHYMVSTAGTYKLLFDREKER